MRKKLYAKRAKHSAKAGIPKIFWILILLIFIATFIYSMVQIVLWVKSTKDLESLEEGLFTDVVMSNETIVDTNTEEGETTETVQEIKIDFEKLEETNSDTVGWIIVEGTNISYPITQHTDNDYYLRRDFYQKYNSCGNIFLDYKANKEFLDDNTIIYGHNLNNGKMFSELNKIYYGQLGTNINIQIFTKQGKYNYKIKSAYAIEVTEDILQRNFKR